MKIHAKKALVEGKWLQDCVVTVEDGVIVSIQPGNQGDVSVPILTPGLFDKHHHGGVGFDATSPDKALCEVWLKMLLSHGVTNILYTLGTGPIEKTRKAIEFAAWIMAEQAEGRLPGARVMGVHLEGPFINPIRKGAMNDAYILPPTMENYLALVGEHGDIIRAITMAPEMPGAFELAEQLTALGVKIQAGHTDATYACMEEAVKHGFAGLTHTFNAMPGINHRAPGPVAFGMLNKDICLEAICDFVHLDWPAIAMLWQARGPEGIAMISDSVTTAGLPDGEYVGGNHYVRVEGGRNFTRSGGIAGSWCQMDTGVTNLAYAGLPLEEIIQAASMTPAAYVRMTDKLGSIAPGKMACLAAWDEDIRCLWGFDGKHIEYAH